MELHQDFKEFLELLIEKKAEYLIVGAYALAMHGHPRYTGDIDIWIKNSKENSEKVYEALREFGFPVSEIAADNFEEDDQIFQIGYPPVRIDILTSVEALNFDNSYEKREKKIIQGLFINYLNLEDFKKNKKAVGRARDLADLEALEE